MSNLNEQIKQAAKGNAFLFGSNREIRRLPEYLHDGEEVLSIITGGRMGKRGRGIIVATNERLLLIWDGWVFRENQDFPYETISSVEFNTRIFFGSLTVYGKGDETSYNWIGRFAGAKFTKLVRQLTSDAGRNQRDYQNTLQSRSDGLVATPGAGVALPMSEPDRIMKQIQDLGTLRDQGHINLVDYENKKAELLSRL